MTIRLYLIAGHGSRVADLSGNRDPNQGLQHAIHRGPGNLWHSFPNVAEDLIRGRMILTKGQCLQNHPPLNCERHTVLATDPGEFVKRRTDTARQT
jgi:hypothetical protein